jgi:hypothetical protein
LLDLHLHDLRQPLRGLFKSVGCVIVVKAAANRQL